MRYLQKLLEKPSYVPKVNLPALARKHKKFMSCFQARPGNVFVSQDVVSLEPVITAEFSKDPLYKYAAYAGIGKKPEYRNGLLMIDDIYCMVGSFLPHTKDAMARHFERGLFNNWENLTDDERDPVKDSCKKDARNPAKTAALGLGYGMGAPKLAKTSAEAGFPITLEVARAVKDTYWATFAGLANLRDYLSWEIKKKGAVINPFGYRLTPEPHKAFNAYIQSSASGVLDVYGRFMLHEKSPIKFVALIHDELIFEIPESFLDEFKFRGQESVKDLNDALGWECPIRLGTKVAKTFAEVK